MEFRVLGLIDNTHAAFTELLSDPVVGDRGADHAGPILPPYGLMVITTVRMNYDIFSSPGA